MELLEKAKLALRLKTAAFDDEVKGLIAAAIEDLESVGVNAAQPENVSETSTISEKLKHRIEQAILLYCKGHFGYNPDAERFLKTYKIKKIALHMERGRQNAVER